MQIYNRKPGLKVDDYNNASAYRTSLKANDTDQGAALSYTQNSSRGERVKLTPSNHDRAMQGIRRSGTFTDSNFLPSYGLNAEFTLVNDKSDVKQRVYIKQGYSVGPSVRSASNLATFEKNGENREIPLPSEHHSAQKKPRGI